VEYRGKGSLRRATSGLAVALFGEHSTMNSANPVPPQIMLNTAGTLCLLPISRDASCLFSPP
jgi:hypothetical protein